MNRKSSPESLDVLHSATELLAQRGQLQGDFRRNAAALLVGFEALLRARGEHGSVDRLMDQSVDYSVDYSIGYSIDC